MPSITWIVVSGLMKFAVPMDTAVAPARMNSSASSAVMIPPIPIKAKYFVLLYGAAELFFGLQNSVGDNVAHFAHLGGMLFGFFLILYWRKHSKKFY